MNNRMTEIVDYILDSEYENFFDNIEEAGLLNSEIKILKVYKGNGNLTNDVKDIFRKLENKHIYATALCQYYDL